MLTIATRGSTLAMWQARHVEALLGTQTRLEIIRTTGDRITDVPLSSIGDRGLFTRELDNALLEGVADCAVHSLKDVPTLLPPGLRIAAVLKREDPRDAWVARNGVSRIDTLLPGARVGTSSLRRRALLMATRPDLVCADVRGNLDTRLEKLQRGDYDALILAFAGLHRLGRGDAVTHLIDTPHWLPAPAQGAIAVVARDDDAATNALLARIDHAATATAVRAERALLRTLEGGCQVPIGALATIGAEGMLDVHGLIADPDGSRVVRASMSGPADDPEAIGRSVAEDLRSRGGGDILAALSRSTAATPEVSPP